MESGCQFFPKFSENEDDLINLNFGNSISRVFPEIFRSTRFRSLNFHKFELKGSSFGNSAINSISSSFMPVRYGKYN